ncbi:MAG: histidine kinase N-terminal 7TM domain-containing protein [Patescibacteria group bacterium]
MLSVYSIINWISGVIFLAFGAFLSLGHQKRSTRAYGLVSFALALWAFGVALLMSGFSDWALFLSRFNHYIGALVGPLFLYFAYLFPEEEKPRTRIVAAVILFELCLLPLYLGTDFIVKSTFVTLAPSVDLGWDFGPYGYLFHLNFGVPFFAGFLILVQKLARYRGTALERQVAYLVGGTLLGALFGLCINILLPFFGLFKYSWLGPALSTSWVAIMAYIIHTYSAISVKVIASVLAILILLVILFVNIFVG